MPDDVGTFRVDVEIENPARPGERRKLSSVLVDTGAELSWVPAEVLESLGIERYNKAHFRQADGTILERWVGGAFVHVAGKRTSDDVVFGETGDLVLLGARTLEVAQLSNRAGHQTIGRRGARAGGRGIGSNPLTAVT
jgi:predicted aspartyl protease